MGLSEPTKRRLAEELIIDAVESIEFLSVGEFVNDTLGHDASDDDLRDIDEYIRYCSLDVVFDTDD